MSSCDDDEKRCLLCGSTEYRCWAELENYGYKFSFLKCRECGLIYKHPMPSEDIVKKHYLDYPCFIDRDMRQKHILLGRVRQIERYCQQRGSLLDIGCGVGFLLEVAQERGWDVYGVEPSEQAVAKLPDTVKDKVINGVLTKGLFEDNKFDAVVFWSVLEHISNPLDVLMIAHDILKKGGLLVIQTPDASSLHARYFKGRWLGSGEVDHLCLWSRNTLITQLKKMGFSIRQTRSSGMPFPLGCRAVDSKTTRLAKEAKVIPPRWGKTGNYTIDRLIYWCVRSEKLRTFIRSAINVLRFGDNVEVYATKE